MPFIYPARPHARRHGPSGYADYGSFKPWLRDEFHFRCVYCLERERWDRTGHSAFGIDQVLPQGRPEYEHLICHYDNLVYACNRCNSWRRDAILLDPGTASLADHIQMDLDGMMVGLTEDGVRLIRTLGLNDHRPYTTRQRILRVHRLFQAYPEIPEIRALYFDSFGYPDDLPNLDSLKPENNSRPDGLTDAYSRQRAEGRLPEVYL